MDRNALSSPTQLTAQRLGKRSTSRPTSPFSEGSVKSRRSASLRTSAQANEILDQISVATSISCKSPSRDKEEVPPSAFVQFGEAVVRSLSPTSDSAALENPFEETTELQHDLLATTSLLGTHRGTSSKEEKSDDRIEAMRKSLESPKRGKREPDGQEVPPSTIPPTPAAVATANGDAMENNDPDGESAVPAAVPPTPAAAVTTSKAVSVNGTETSSNVEQNPSQNTDALRVSFGEESVSSSEGKDLAGSRGGCRSGEPLDLTNEESFEVLASVVAQFFEQRLWSGSETILLQPSDRDILERMLPQTARLNLMEAIRSRRENPSPTVTRCLKLGFDLDGPANPIVATMNPSEKPLEVSLKQEEMLHPTHAPSSPPPDGRDSLVATLEPSPIPTEKTLQHQQSDSPIQHPLQNLSEVDNNHADQPKTPERPAETDTTHRSLNFSSLSSAFASQAVPPESPMPQQHTASTTEYKQWVDDDMDDKMVDVVSPADLPGGYSFEAQVGGQRFLATVPPGGVRQGEMFTCAMKHERPSRDYWKVSLIRSFGYVTCRRFLNLILFPLIPLAQVQDRLDLDFLGRPRQSVSRFSNRTILAIVTTSWLLLNLVLLLSYDYKWSMRLELTIPDWLACLTINGSLYVWSVFVTQQTRGSVRESFLIAEDRCVDFEDLLVSATFLPLAIAQMDVQTIDMPGEKHLVQEQTMNDIV